MTATGMGTTAAVITAITAAGTAVGAAGGQDMASVLTVAHVAVHAAADRVAVVADDRAAVVAPAVAVGTLEDQVVVPAAGDMVVADRAAAAVMVEAVAVVGAVANR